MLKNNLIIAIRSLKKKIGFTLVNVLGLAFGMATCVLITLYVQYELSYDDFQNDNIYRMWINRVYPEREVNYPVVPHSFGPQLVNDFPEIIGQGRCFKPFNPNPVRYGDDTYLEDNIVFIDSTFLTLLEIPLKEGDPETAMINDNAIIISESTAKKLFGDDDPIGKKLELFGGSKEVTAVAYDYPEKSHFGFDYLVSLHQFPFFTQPNWVAFSAMTYLKLQAGTDPATLERKFPSFVKQYAEGPIQQRNGISYDEYVESGNGYNYYLHHIKDIHLHSNLENEMKAGGNINYIYIFSIIAVFILTIACINFMNLSTARSTERGKEVGIRKVLGSDKSQIVSQFLMESIVITMLSAIVGFLLAFLVLPVFNELAERPLSIDQLMQPLTIVVIIAIVLVVGILAGLYPAFFISSFHPLSIFKGQLKRSSGGFSLRNILVVLQFTISIALISATLIVFDQMSYMLNKPLGFEKENVVVLENANSIDANGFNITKFETFRNEINNIPNVLSSDYSSTLPGDFAGDMSVRIPGTDQKESLIIRRMVFGDELVNTLDMEILDGRFFSKEFNDSLNLVINQSAVEKLGLENPIGKKIIEIAANAEPIEFTIIGVVNDFHFQSLHVDLKPAAFSSTEGPGAFFTKMAIKVDGANTNETLSQIQSKWQEFVPEMAFTSYYLDEDLERFYNAEKATGRIFGIFTFLAISIACIGLLGLSAFVINQKVKEIGVRKVLGASISSIVLMLSKDFTKLILIAALIAIPLAYYWMNDWVSTFAYNNGINWMAFLFAGGSAIIIGLLTVSFQSVKAAMNNPVNSLKDE